MFCGAPAKQSKQNLVFQGFYAPVKIATIFTIWTIFAKTAISRNIGFFDKKVSQMTTKQARDPNLILKRPQCICTLIPNIQANYEQSGLIGQ